MLTNKTPINTITYTYGNTNWKDQLTSYDGKEITYDAIGNPLTYDGNTYTWQNGRELASIINNDKTIQYKYNDSGIRVSKTVNGVETKYYLEGSNIIYETKGNQIIYYTYNQSGDIIGLNYGGNDYYYVKNIQGDIIGILNSNLEQIASYEYDSWGNITKITDNNGNNITDETNIATINPFRYRSYYYDTETNLYYLNSRYYNPQWGRFINADGLLSTGQGLLGHNMYIYCGNNPINGIDSTGMFWKKVGDFFSNVWREIKTWAKDTFGSESSITQTLIGIETSIIPDPLPINITTGTTSTKIIEQHGDSSKPFSVYSNKDLQHPIIASSAGMNINTKYFTLNSSLGMGDIGNYVSLKDGDTTINYGVKLNLLKLRVGLEYSSEVMNWDTNTIKTEYTNCSFSAWALLEVACLVTMGQSITSLEYAY